MECVALWVEIRRPGLTCAQKTELWDRWQRGESLKAIGRAFGKPSSSIYCQLCRRMAGSVRQRGGAVLGWP